MAGCYDSHYKLLIFLFYLHFEKLTIDGLGLIFTLFFLYGFVKEWYIVFIWYLLEKQTQVYLLKTVLKNLLEVFDQKQNAFV